MNEWIRYFLDDKKHPTGRAGPRQKTNACLTLSFIVRIAIYHTTRFVHNVLLQHYWAMIVFVNILEKWAFEHPLLTVRVTSWGEQINVFRNWVTEPENIRSLSCYKFIAQREIVHGLCRSRRSRVSGQSATSSLVDSRNCVEKWWGTAADGMCRCIVSRVQVLFNPPNTQPILRRCVARGEGWLPPPLDFCLRRRIILL